MRPLSRFFPVVLSLAALSLVSACGDSGTAPPEPATVTTVTSSIAPAAVGATLPAPIVAVVRDAGGTALEGISVTFSVTAGGGSVSPATTTTNGDGQAIANWTLGTLPGTQTAQAAVAGVTGRATFTTTATAGAPRSISVQAGNMQTTTAGAQVAVAPSVLVQDEFSNPVPNVSVFFSITAGGGTVSASGATTNANGIASAGSWTLGPNVGINRLAALAVSGGVAGNPIEFTATAVAGSAARVVAATATTIAGVVGTSVTPAPRVRVTDAAGNPVAGVQVTFAGSAGSSVSGAIVLSDATGAAAVGSWLLGTAAQSYTLTATVAGGATPATFTATAAAGAAASVATFAGTGQSAAVGRPVAVEPAVRVLDSFDNPISGVQVAFSVTGGGGFALGRNPVTNANGVATVGGWSLGETPGPNTLRATVIGAGIAGNPITFEATATPGTPSSMTLQAGNGQTAVAGSAVTVAPSVVVRDNRGNPVSGVVVQFVVGTGAGVLTGADAITNSAGVATVGAWRLGSAVGTQTLLARITGVPDVTFTATAIAGSPRQAVAVSATNLGTVVVNTLVATLPSVRVNDSLGNPVAGAEVRFEISSADTTGALTGAIQVTNAAGIATLGSWRVGTLANSVSTVRARVTGLDLAGAEPTFTATKIAGAPAAIAAAPGSVQNQVNQTVSTAVASIPAVRVTDAFGNSVTGVAVTFTAAAGNGVVAGSPATSDANGVARITSWTMPATPGTHTLTASVGATAVPMIVFTADVP